MPIFDQSTSSIRVTPDTDELSQSMVRDHTNVAAVAREIILDKPNSQEFLEAIHIVLKAIKEDPQIVNPNFQEGLFEKVRSVVLSPFADERSRSAGLEVMVRMEPMYSRFLLFGMFYEENVGTFAVNESLRLSTGESIFTPLIPRDDLVNFFQGNLADLMSEFSSLDGDTTAQSRVRTGLLNQAAFMAATGSNEGREFLENLLNCRDYDLQKQLLIRLGDLGGYAVQSIYVVGEFLNNLEKRFNREDARDIGEVAQTTLSRIAQGYASLSSEEQSLVVPATLVQKLQEWLIESQLDEVAAFLKRQSD